MLVITKHFSLRSGCLTKISLTSLLLVSEDGYLRMECHQGGLGAHCEGRREALVTTGLMMTG